MAVPQRPTRLIDRLRRWAPLWLCLAALAALPAFAIDDRLDLEDLRFARWSVDDGLPQIAVLALAQDHDGYLWIGTQSGIARFDGVRFTVYDRHGTGLDTSMANVALVDSRNRVWFGTPRGALCFDGAGVKMLRRTGDAVGVTSIAEREDGSLVFASESGLLVTDGEQLLPLEGYGTPAHALLADGRHLWVAGNGQVRNLTEPDAAPIALPSPTLRIHVIRRHGNTLWLGGDNGVWRLDPVSRRLQPADPALQGFAVSALLSDRDGNLWIGSDSALLRRRPDGRIDSTDGSEFGIQLWIHALIEGSEGQIWIGAHRDSLIRISDNSGIRVGTRNGLSDLFVWSLVKDDDGSVLIGTNSGLERRTADGRVHPVLRGSDLPDPSIYTMSRADDGFWLGTRRGLALWSQGRVSVPPILDPLRPHQINTILRNGPDDYWFGTSNGLYRLRGNELDHLAVESGRSVARIRSLLPVGPDDLLIGTEDGLRRVRNGRYETLPWASQLDQTLISRLTWVRPDLLGIGTLDRGLGLVKLARDANGQVPAEALEGDVALRLVDIDRGLSSRNLWTLDPVGDYLYVGSLQGVYRVRLADLPDPAADPEAPIEIQYVYAEPGRNVRSLQRLACCNGGADSRSLVDDHWIWYATTDGAVRVDSTAVKPRPAPPRPHVEAVRNDGTLFSPGESITITGFVRDPAIEYTGLSMIDSEMIEFRYQLQGYDRDWREADTRRVAYYTHLPPGDFHFEVQARHPTGQWSDSSQAVRIRVMPHWYEQRGLQALAAMALVAGLAAAIRYRSRRDALLRQKLEWAVSERTAALQRAVAKLRDANDTLAQESRTDPLTGLANRRLQLGEVAPSGVIALIDLDHFKSVNDRYGHAVGDKVLIEMAGLLKGFVGNDDRLVRWGGEEFLLFLPGRTMADALDACDAFRRHVAGHVFQLPNGETLHVTCSIGLAEHSGTDHWHAALDLADVALYRAKHGGRNRTIGVRLKDDVDPQKRSFTGLNPDSTELEWLAGETHAEAVPQRVWPGIS